VRDQQIRIHLPDRLQLAGGKAASNQIAPGSSSTRATASGQPPAPGQLPPTAVVCGADVEVNPRVGAVRARGAVISCCTARRGAASSAEERSAPARAPTLRSRARTRSNRVIRKLTPPFPPLFRPGGPGFSPPPKVSLSRLEKAVGWSGRQMHKSLQRAAGCVSTPPRLRGAAITLGRLRWRAQRRASMMTATWAGKAGRSSRGRNWR